MLEILIQGKEKEKEIAVFENQVLTERYLENETTKRLEGNIYIGRVVNVLKGIQAAFVDLGEEKNAYIHVKDLIPSPDDIRGTKDVLVTTLDIHQYIQQGDYILVQVKRDATNLKGARVSTHISLPGRFCVFLPGANFLTISQKITDKEERERHEKYMRMALILKLLEEAEKNPKREDRSEPSFIRGKIKCTNPKCITCDEQELAHVFKPAQDGGYRCIYCEQKAEENQ